MIKGDMLPRTGKSVSKYHSAWRYYPENGAQRASSEPPKAAKWGMIQLKKHNVDALVAIGGDGTF